MSLRNRVPKHQNKGATLVEVGPIPRSSKCLSPESSGICCLPTGLTPRRTREQKRQWNRRREREGSSSSYSFPLHELKMDSRRNASIAVLRDCNCSPSWNTWDSFTLVAHSDGATNIRPPQQEKRRQEEKEENEWVGWSAFIQCQCPKGCSRWHIMDHPLSCGEQRSHGFYYFITNTTVRGLIIQTDQGSGLSFSMGN